MALVVWLGFAVSLVLATEPKATRPTLTQVQRLELVSALQQIEIAQLRAQMAQRDFDAAKDRLRGLVESAKHPGYVLDLQTLEYRPEPPESEPVRP